MDSGYSRHSRAVRILWITATFCSQMFPNCSRESHLIPPRLFPNCSDQGGEAPPYLATRILQLASNSIGRRRYSRYRWLYSRKSRTVAKCPLRPVAKLRSPPQTSAIQDCGIRPLLWPQIPLGPDKLDFDRVICENVAPPLPGVLMAETISKSMANPPQPEAPTMGAFFMCSR